MNHDPGAGDDDPAGGQGQNGAGEPDESAGASEPWEAADGPAPVPVDPGDPSAENVAFVVLGALLTLFALARVAGVV